MITALSQPPSSSHRPDRVPTSTPLEPLWSPLIIRLATADDQSALSRLAQLDSRPTPAGSTLMAELRGRAVAAVSLGDGEQVADPFLPTSEITELLRLRARQLSHRGH
jgi:hypothetical protein